MRMKLGEATIVPCRNTSSRLLSDSTALCLYSTQRTTLESLQKSCAGMKGETLGRRNLSSQAGWKGHFPECTRFKTSAPQRTCLHPHPRPPRPPSSSSAQSPGMVCRLYSNAVPSSECRKMETTDSTELSPSR